MEFRWLAFGCFTFYSHFLACMERHKDKTDHPAVVKVRVRIRSGWRGRGFAVVRQLSSAHSLLVQRFVSRQAVKTGLAQLEKKKERSKNCKRYRQNLKNRVNTRKHRDVLFVKCRCFTSSHTNTRVCLHGVVIFVIYMCQKNLNVSV